MKHLINWNELERKCEAIRNAFRMMRKEGITCHFKYDYDKFDTHEANASIPAKEWKKFHYGEISECRISFETDGKTGKKIVGVLGKLGIHYQWDGSDSMCIVLFGEGREEI